MKKFGFLIVVVSILLLEFQGLIAQPGNRGQHKLNQALIEVTNVPQLVKDTQQRMFPGTTVDKWLVNERPNKGGNKGMSKPVVYIARFKNQEGYITHCRITENGEVRGHMTMLQGEKGLPANIKDAVLKRFSGYKIQGSQKIYLAKNNKSAYRIVLVQNSTRVITFVDENGNELKEENLSPEIKENILEVPEKE